MMCDNDCINNFNSSIGLIKNDSMMKYLNNCMNENIYENNLSDLCILENDNDLFNNNSKNLNLTNAFEMNETINNISISDLCVYKNNNLCDFNDLNLINYCKIDGRPFNKITLNNLKVYALFDTGAKISVVDRNVVKKLGLKISKEKSKSVSCANGSELIILGKIRINVEFNNKIVKGEFYVADKIYPEVVIGIDVLDILKIRLVEIDDMMNNVLSLEAKFHKNISNMENLKNIDISKNHILFPIISKYKHIFMRNKWDIGRTEIIKHRILTECPPILIKSRRQPVHYEIQIEEIIKNLEENNIIKKCESPWNSPIVCVKKKESNEIRMCLDFRQLNKNTVRPAFPIPNINEMLDSLHGSQYFSSIDLGNAYYQVELEDESKEKTAFSTRYGQYCFNRMPFGIAAAPSTFQNLMSIIVGDMMWKEALVYLDDILIFSKTIEEHKIRIEKLFKRIDASGLKVNPEKCKFLVPELKFLGHIISNYGIKTDMSKIDAIKEFKTPTCIKHLRSFLGLANYYRKFIRDYSKIAKPLEELIGCKNKKLIWTEKCKISFDSLKDKLMKAPILGHPDFKKTFILDTDASFDSIGAVLSQYDENGKEIIIAFGSKAMSKHEIGYCITRKELLSIYYFTQHFKHYLYGKKFILRTDHKAITFMMTTKKPITAQFQNWINFLSSLDMKLEYRKGGLHNNADALSRFNTVECKQCQMAHHDAKTEKLKTRLLTISENKVSYK